MSSLVTLLLAASLDTAAVALASGAVVPADPGDHGPWAGISSFLDLPPGDALNVRYHSFNGHSLAVYDLTFHRGATRSVTVVLVRSAPAGARTPRKLATLMVSDSTAMDLDRLMRLCRAGPAEHGRSGLRLELSQFHDGILVSREIIPSVPAMPGLGDCGLGTLISRARKAAPASALSDEYR